MQCTADQIVIVAGAQQGIDFAARLLLNPNDAIWMEEPGYTQIRHLFELADLSVISVPVDEEGLDVKAGHQRCRAARLAYVTPSSQWPLGVTMSLARRLELLEWARQNRAWIVEDDYNGEYHYSGRPLQTLYGLDEAERVIYVGSFSKLIFPGLRLAYIVVPPQYSDAFAAARRLADRHSPPFEQATLADFIEQGHFARHVRRMRKLYRSRRETIVGELRKRFSDVLDILPNHAGMHVVAKGRTRAVERQIMTAATSAGVEFQDVSLYASDARRASGLILGFAAYDQNEISTAVRRWSEAFFN